MALVGVGVLALLRMFEAGAVLDLGELGFEGLGGEFLQAFVDGGVDLETALVGLFVGEEVGEFVLDDLHRVVVLAVGHAVA